MKRILFIFCLFFLVACLPEKPVGEIIFEKDTIQVLRKGEPLTSITVEIADTNTKRIRGLMYRTELGDHEGMLFLFPARKKISMWMANTPLSLDMIFINENGKITQIVENTPPFSHEEIMSEKIVKSVLELKGGVSEKLGLRVGDIIDYPFFKLEKD